MSRTFSKSSFNEGSILRVKMKNFLTYEDCEVTPGPKLNIVIGPNGTGKSALTHAICLACCGTPKDVGRSNDLTNYVMKGKEGQESFVEVDLLGPDRTSITIRRSINSDTRGSKWLLNGKNETQSNVKALVKSMHIDLDNLCSFMPQERVGTFSTLSPAAILETTLKSLGGELGQEQDALAGIEKSKEESRQDRDAKQTQLTHYTHQMESMHDELERLRSREEAKKHLQYCRIVKTRVEGAALKEQLESRQQELDEATARLNRELESIEPLEVAVRDLRRKQAGRNKTAEAAQMKQRQFEQQLRKRRDEVVELEGSVQTVRDALTGLERERLRKQTELQRTEEKLASEQAELEVALKAVPSLHQLQDENSAQMAAMAERKAALEDENQGCKSRCYELADQVKVLTNEYKGLQDRGQVFKAKLQFMANRNPNNPRLRDTLAAMQWLESKEEELRARGQLRGQILGPVAMLCDVADPACAAMLEKLIPENKLLALIVDNDHDAALLRNELRTKQRLVVDVYTMKNAVLDQTRIYSSEMLSSGCFRGLNIKYLADEIVCPDVVRAFLNAFHGLNTVLWGRSENATVDEEHSTRLCPPSLPQFRLFMHDIASAAASQQARARGGARNNHEQQQQLNITLFSGKRSSFDRGGAPSLTAILVRAGRGLLCGADDLGGGDVDQRRAELEQRITSAQQQLVTLNAQSQQLIDQIRHVNTQKSQLNQDRAEIIAGLRLPETKKRAVDSLKRKQHEYQQLLAAGVERDKAKLVTEYEVAMEALLRGIEAVAVAAEKSNQFAVELGVAMRLRDELLAAIRAADEDLDNAKENLVTYEQLVQQAEQARNEANRQYSKNSLEMRELIVASGVTPTEFATQVYPVASDYCDPGTPLDEIERRMAVLSATIENIVENPQLQARFEQVRANVERLREEVRTASVGYDEAEESLRERFRRWLDAVKAIVEKLNVKFAHYMSKLLFRGEIRLIETGTICNYEVDIRVSFREESDLASLSGSRHSGGERAVSTVMYLMALQDMTRSPFRVVDEINQGMDEVNERLVFDRIVHECCSAESKSQYFLITPKLLEALGAMDNDAITVLLVWNGPGVGKKWHFGQLLQTMMAQQGLLVDGAGEDGRDGDGEDAFEGLSAASVAAVGKRSVAISGAAATGRSKRIRAS